MVMRWMSYCISKGSVEKQISHPPSVGTSAAVGTRGYLRCLDSFTGIFSVAGLGDVLVLACHCSGGSWLRHPGALTPRGVLQC